MPKMGLDFGLESAALCAKRKFRWLLSIPNVSADGINTLPPQKSARPSISFKEIAVEHLNETIYYPGKPDWKPVELVLYDLNKNSHPVFNWLQKLYIPASGTYRPPLDGQFIIDRATLKLFDGCGTIIEQWVYENVWPQTVEFGDLDMGDADVVTCNLTLRYARAYLES